MRFIWSARIKSPFRVIAKLKYKFFGKPLHLLNHHKSYDDYLAKQKEKTLDPKCIEKWLGEEWEMKLEGFRKLFERNAEYLNDAANCICLGARTGQEVAAIRELGKQAIGIDLVEFKPYTVQGDIHNLDHKDSSVDFIFTNIFDHSLYPDRFISEMERVCEPSGHIIINLQLFTSGDDYSENVINDPRKVIALFKNSTVVESRKIQNSFDSMNWEL